MATRKYAIVQHSGFGYGGNPQFEQGLEVRSVTRKADQTKVEKLGGKLFDNYVQADEYADAEPYPAHYGGLIPKAPGRFADFEVDGLRVYLPKEA